jgi:peptidoglycan/LPS O-acetylase OafA/YrhL
MVAMALLRDNQDILISYPEIAINNFLLPACIAVFFYGLLKETTWITSLLSTRIFQVLGKSSYAFYLIHIGVIQQFLSKEVTGNTIFLFVLLNGIAIVLHYLIESPLQGVMRGKGS